MLILISTPVSIYWSVNFKGPNTDTTPSPFILSPGTEPTKLVTIQQDLDLPMYLTTEPQVPGTSHVVIVPVPMGTMPQDPDHTLDPYPSCPVESPQTIHSFLDELCDTITNHSDLHDLAISSGIPISKVDKAITDNPGNIENCVNQVIFIWWRSSNVLLVLRLTSCRMALKIDLLFSGGYWLKIEL